jgi:hypothetical protein
LRAAIRIGTDDLFLLIFSLLFDGTDFGATGTYGW